MTTATNVAAGPTAVRRSRARIDGAQLRALLAADVRRLGPPVARSTAAVLVLLALALVTGIGNRGMVTGLMTALLVMQPMFLALQLVKDKLDGNLAFLCALPVTPETLAAVRVVPVVALSLMGGAATAAIALWNGVPAATGHGAAAVTVTVLLLGALVPAALASVVLALGARFRFETLASLPMLLLIALVAAIELAGKLVPASTAERLRALLEQPWTPAVLVALLAGMLVGIVLLSHRVTAHTFARYTPERRGG